MNVDKALAWTRRRKQVPPAPWWKRPVQRVAELKPSGNGPKLPDPRAAASNRWAVGGAAAVGVGATAAGIVAFARRRRQADGDTDASETPGDATTPSQNPGTAADSSESSPTAEAGSGASMPSDAQGDAEERTET